MKNLFTVITRKELTERMGMSIDEIKSDPYHAYQAFNRFRIDDSLKAELIAVVDKDADDLLHAVAFSSDEHTPG